jgi:hypothetical protein
MVMKGHCRTDAATTQVHTAKEKGRACSYAEYGPEYLHNTIWTCLRNVRGDDAAMGNKIDAEIQDFFSKTMGDDPKVVTIEHEIDPESKKDWYLSRADTELWGPVGAQVPPEKIVKIESCVDPSHNVRPMRDPPDTWYDYTVLWKRSNPK